MKHEEFLAAILSRTSAADQHQAIGAVMEAGYRECGRSLEGDALRRPRSRMRCGPRII